MVTGGLSILQLKAISKSKKVFSDYPFIIFNVKFIRKFGESCGQHILQAEKVT